MPAHRLAVIDSAFAVDWAPSPSSFAAAAIAPNGTSAPAPATPIFSVQPAIETLAAGETSNFGDGTGGSTSDEDKHFRWAVVAVSDSGVSDPVVSDNLDTAGAGVTIKGKKVTFTLSSADATVRYFRVFRVSTAAALDGSAATIAKTEFAFSMAKGGATTVVTDANLNIPGTAWAFSLQMTPDVVEVVRLLDMMKQDLAIVNTTKEFLLILFAAFRSRTPTKLWAWKNCGVLTPALDAVSF